MKLDSDRRQNTDYFSNKFIGKFESAFSSLPRPVNWLSFYQNDLTSYLKLSKEVKEVAIEKKLNKSQTKALQKVKDKSPEAFEGIKKKGKAPIKYFLDEEDVIEEMSAREIERVPDIIEAKKENKYHKSGNLDLPEKKYRCLVVDPPWPVMKIIREVRPNQKKHLDYRVMSIMVHLILSLSILTICQKISSLRNQIKFRLRKIKGEIDYGYSALFTRTY